MAVSAIAAAFGGGAQCKIGGGNVVRKTDGRIAPPFLALQAELDFTYAAVGATRLTPPPGYVVDHTRIRLGEGEASFRPPRPPCGGGNISTWAGSRPGRPRLQFGPASRGGDGPCRRLWWLNACRIIYVVDDSGPTSRFGFAYGTLPGHVERGEERFLIEWDQRDGSVWYDILAFSRPRHVLARLGYPLVRRLQKRFGRDSAASMLRAVRPAIQAGASRRRTRNGPWPVDLVLALQSRQSMHRAIDGRKRRKRCAPSFVCRDALTALDRKPDHPPARTFGFLHSGPPSPAASSARRLPPQMPHFQCDKPAGRPFPSPGAVRPLGLASSPRSECRGCQFVLERNARHRRVLHRGNEH